MPTFTTAENLRVAVASLWGVMSLMAPSGMYFFSMLAPLAQSVMSLELPFGPVNDGFRAPVVINRKLLVFTSVLAIVSAEGLSCATVRGRHAADSRQAIDISTIACLSISRAFTNRQDRCFRFAMKGTVSSSTLSEKFLVSSCESQECVRFEVFLKKIHNNGIARLRHGRQVTDVTNHAWVCKNNNLGVQEGASQSIKRRHSEAKPCESATYDDYDITPGSLSLLDGRGCADNGASQLCPPHVQCGMGYPPRFCGAAVFQADGA
jgi:hypothetical protein